MWLGLLWLLRREHKLHALAPGAQRVVGKKRHDGCEVITSSRADAQRTHSATRQETEGAADARLRREQGVEEHFVA